MSINRPASTTRRRVLTVEAGARREREDLLATEEPLEIRVAVDGATHSVAVTMRTPGHDFELAAGFLFTEGAITNRESIEQIKYCVRGVGPAAEQQYNIVTVQLRPGTTFDINRFSRYVFTSSSCGVCGKQSLEQVRAACPAARVDPPQLADAYVTALPVTLRAEQDLFAKTGGLHAAALFDPAGKLLLVREDVGRHNALDKLIGALLLKDRVPAHDRVLLVSGRASFELVQKALMAGIPVLAAVGAPSSLAVELAEEFGMRLIGFLREGRFNVYAGNE